MNTSNRRQLLQQLAGAAAVWPVATCLAQVASTKSKPIRIGQIGVGHAHASKLRVYRQSSDYEVVGIVERDPLLRSQAEMQDAFRGLPWMSEEQLLNTKGLQAVLVETRVR